MDKAPCGYVGLRNLGATCYMNSLLQQLFLIPELRAAILQVACVLGRAAEGGVIWVSVGRFRLLRRTNQIVSCTSCRPFLDFCRKVSGSTMRPEIYAMHTGKFSFLAMRFQKIISGA